ncbi:MAG: cryptochrome/photolyase family protein [Bacteroidota bacterium]
MSSIKLLFPHQLFEQIPLGLGKTPYYLVEEHLYFKHFAFHQQKIAFHRASMRCYADHLLAEGATVNYIPSTDTRSDIRQLIAWLGAEGVKEINYIDPTDDWLNKRLHSAMQKAEIRGQKSHNPLFLNRPEDLAAFFRKDKKKFFQTRFYKEQRVLRGILVDAANNPEGGKWTYDVDNRKKYPAKKIPPAIEFPETDAYYEEAKTYVAQHFAHCPGHLSQTPLYATNFSEAKAWLNQFFEKRFLEFGPYEDAIVSGQGILNHSVLTPMLNVGLLTPDYVIEQSLKFARENIIPINSLEGFIRQIIGWREFIRGVYECKGGEERTRNYWGFERKIPDSFYTGTTGIDPIDITIKKVLRTGYCHHIERLMVLGNFMMLCEFDPDEVYRWFMELFIDAYDWVMVPNVYGMSQYADGGLMSTKPYISGSNYLMKMSNYKKGPWQATWDALFWRFMNVHRQFFLKNPRLGMLVRTYDKMAEEKQEKLMNTADVYLAAL